LRGRIFSIAASLIGLLPAPSPSRGPPQQVFDFDQTLDDELFDIPFDADA
jgi:hypothetical protein